MELEVGGVDALAHGQSLVFHYARRGRIEQGFVLRVGLRLVAYRNLCAHWHVDLDMGAGDFWSERLQRIQCRTHGAAYEPFTGVCDLGPCVGGRLEGFAVEDRGDRALIHIDD